MPLRHLTVLVLTMAALALPGHARAQNAANGQQLFQAYCEVCHGSPPANGPDRAPNDPARIRAAMTVNVPDMFPLRFLSDAQLADIAAYIARALNVATPTANYTALWWIPSESGWGINLNHQGDIVFGTLFTYDASGAPMWLVMDRGALVSGTTYSGALYRTTGPAFNANPFNPSAVGATAVGTMTVTFTSADTATLTYTVNGAAVSKSIRRQVYGSRAANCVPTTGSRTGLTNYQDLWWNPAESGWGVNVTHQDNTLFATLFTYDATGRDLWLVMDNGVRVTGSTYSGPIYRTSGPAFNANPFNPAAVGATAVGTMTFSFTDGNTGTLTYTYNGAPVTKQITRQVFSSPVPACS